MSRTKAVRVAAVALAAVMGFVVAGWVVAQDTVPPKADVPVPETKVADPKVPAGPAVAWAADLAKAQEKAKAENKLVFMDFRADWCPPCKLLDKQTFTDAKVIAALNEMAPVQIDRDKDEATSDQYKVGGIPTLVVTDSAGVEVARTVGYLPPDKFLDFLDFTKARLILNKDPKNAAAAATVAVKSPVLATMSDPERGQLAATALTLNAAAPSDLRSRLLFLRGRGALGEASTQEAGLKDVQEAIKLDPENAAGIKEQGEWTAIEAAANATKDMAALGVAAEKFLADYPITKIKDRNLHASVLVQVVYPYRMSLGDLKGAIAALELLKAEHQDILDAEKVDNQINLIKLEIAKKEAAEAIQKSEKPVAPQEPTKVEEPKKAE